MQKKQLIFATLFVLVTIGLGLLLYRVFFYTPPPVAPLAPEEPGVADQVFPPSDQRGERDVVTPPEELPTAKEIARREIAPPRTTKPAVEKLSYADMKGLNLADGKMGYYNNTDGKFYTITDSGAVRELSGKVFYNVEDTTWSPNNTEAILEYPDGANIYYDFEKEKAVTLPKHWEDFDFSTNGSKIAAKSMGFSEENRWLVTANPDGTEVKLVEALGDNANKVIVDWSPNNQVLALATTADAEGYRQRLLFVGKNHENFSSTIVEGRGLQTQWSPSGKKLLYSVFNPNSDFKPELWIVGSAPGSIGTGRKPLKVTTFAPKCTFGDERFVYCGVPTDMPVGAGFGPEIANESPDRLYKIDTVTGRYEEIPLDRNNHVIQNVFVDAQTNTLFFTDVFEQGLFSVAL